MSPWIMAALLDSVADHPGALGGEGLAAILRPCRGAALGGAAAAAAPGGVLQAPVALAAGTRRVLRALVGGVRRPHRPVHAGELRRRHQHARSARAALRAVRRLVAPR